MFQVALQPLRLSAFVSATELSGRLQLLEEWSCEINGENGEKMIVDIPLDEDTFSSNDVKVKVPRSVSKTLVDNRVRMDMAIKLWYLKSNVHGTSHPFRLCDRALETTAHNGKMSINRASAWLETPEATEVLQTMRFEESDDSHSTTQRWQSASMLANQCGFPSKLCYHALEICNDDVTRAGYWLFDHASNLYAKLDYYSGNSKRCR